MPTACTHNRPASQRSAALPASASPPTAPTTHPRPPCSASTPPCRPDDAPDPPDPLKRRAEKRSAFRRTVAECAALFRPTVCIWGRFVDARAAMIFAAPWVLLALAALPLLWWLLRVTPP